MFRMNRRPLLIVILSALIIGLWSGLSFALTWTPNLDSSTHTESVSSTETSVKVSWDAMTPGTGETADSYTYLWDNTSVFNLAYTKISKNISCPD